MSDPFQRDESNEQLASEPSTHPHCPASPPIVPTSRHALTVTPKQSPTFPLSPKGQGQRIICSQHTYTYIHQKLFLGHKQADTDKRKIQINLENLYHEQANSNTTFLKTYASKHRQVGILRIFLIILEAAF